MLVNAVGLIANPASGKDIRRLVAQATVFNNNEKASLVRRLLIGAQAAGVKRAYYMPDYFGVVPQALAGLAGQFELKMDVCQLEMPLTGGQADTLAAARLLAERRVGCIITLGGDGTNRIVARVCGDVPILPVSTGTNNVFPYMVEGTIAGLAAGLLAAGRVDRGTALGRTKKILIFVNGREVDLALVDAVVMEEQFIGSRAIWNTGNIKQIVATRGELTNIGIASVVGALHSLPAADSRGIALEIGAGGFRVLAALGPGLFRTVPVAGYRLLNPGDRVPVAKVPCIIAVDGEREIEIGQEDRVELVLSNEGPLVVNIKSTMDAAAEQGLFRLYSDSREER